MAEEFTAKFKVDISDLKKNISDATKQIKLANATFKAETAGMEKWSKDTDGLSKRLDQLKKTLQAQKTILTSYKQQLQKQQEAYDENGKRAEQLKNKLKQLAEQGVSKASAEYKEYQSALKAVVKEQQNNGKAIEDLNLQILDQEAAVKTTERSINYYTDSLQQLEKEQKDAAEAANRQKTAYEETEETIKDQQARLDELKSKYANVVVEQGKTSAAAEELARDIDSLSGELKENRDKLADADKAADDLDQSLKDVGDEADNASGGFTVMKGALANLVADGIRMATQAIKDFVTETINVGKEFDKSMSNVAALSRATGDELELLRDTAKEFGSTTQFSASEAADALGYMALAGWDANQSSKALGGVLDLAAASGMDLAAASDMVTDYMSAFGIQADKSAYFADLLAYAQANANTTAQGLGEAFKNSAANMNAAGQDIETTVSLLSMMANQGLKGSEAGTALTAVMRDMTAKMKDGAIAIGDTTVQVMDANGNYRDMTDILLDVENAVNGMGDAERASALQSTFTADSIKGLNLILNAGVGEAAAFENELRNSTGAAGDMAKVMNDNLSGDLTALSSQFEGVQLALYEKFEPALRKGVDALSWLIDKLSWIIDHGETITAVIIGVGTAVGTFLTIINRKAIMTAFLGILTKIKSGFLALNAVMAANPIGLVVAAIAGLIAAFVYLWNTSEDFRNFWINLWDNIKKVVGVAWEKIKEIWGVVAEWFSTKVIQPISEFFSNLGKKLSEFFSDAWGNIRKIWESVATWFKEKVIEPVKNFFEPLIEWFSNLFENIWKSIEDAFAIIGQLAEGCVLLIQEAWSIVSGWFNENIIQPVSEFFSGLWSGISQAASNAWNGIKKTWSVVKDWFKTNITEPVKNAFSNAWTSLKNGASNAWTGIKNVFKSIPDWFREKFANAWQKVKNVFSTGGKIFDGIKEGITSAFKAVVNAIIRGINKVIAFPFNSINKVLDKIRGVSILGLSPFKNLGRISVPQIPELAQGGVLRRGQMGLLEGTGAEAVVPLDRNKKWISAVANDLLSTLRKQAGAGISTSTATTSNVTNFTQIINAPKQPSRIELYRQTRNLLEFAKGDA